MFQASETAATILPAAGVDIFAGIDLRKELSVLNMVSDWAKDNRGTLKGLGISAVSLAVMGFTGADQVPDEGGSGFFFTLIEKPLTVLTTSLVLGGVYGFVYSTFNDVRAYQKQSLEMKGPIGDDKRMITEAARADLLERLERQAKEEAANLDGSINQSKYQTNLATLRGKTGFHRIEAKPDLTKTDVFNHIIKTTVQEASEGLGVGVSITLLPAFLYSEITGMINESIMRYDTGVPAVDITTSLAPRIITDVIIGALGGYNAYNSFILALQQRSAVVESQK